MKHSLTTTEKPQYSEAEIHAIAGRLKHGLITLNDVPKELLYSPQIVEVGRELKLRKNSKRGYDVISGKYYVCEIINYGTKREPCKREVERSFDSFDDYYVFLNGDIYKKACYYGLDISENLMEKYSIKKSKLNYAPICDEELSTVPDITVRDTGDTKELDEDKKNRQEWIDCLLSCDNYKEFRTHIKQCKKTKYRDDLDFILFCYIFADPQKAFNNIMEFVSDGEYPAVCIEYALCCIYNPDDVVNNYKYRFGSNTTINKYKRRMRKTADAVKNGSIRIDRRAYYDFNKQYYCVNDIIHGIPYSTGIRFNVPHYFETFTEFVEYLNHDISGCDLSDAPITLSDCSICKYDITTKFPMKTDQLNMKVKKWYDTEDHRFYVRQQWLDENNNERDNRRRSFNHFSEFVAFLNGDLSDADLLMCEGLINLPNYEGLILDNALMTSVVKEKLGIELIPHKYDLETDLSFPEESLNETLPDVIHEMVDDEGWNPNRRYIAYVSDIHLIHRIKKAQCRTKEDIIFEIRKIAEKILDFGLVLVGGDVSSSFPLFSLFVSILGQMRIDTKSRNTVIFLLGNHEFWPFSGSTIDEIYKKYEELITENGMILLHNEMLVQTDQDTIKISETDLNAGDKGKITDYFKQARLVILGGTGFAGHSDSLNADNGAYRNTISREQEIAESKRFDALYLKTLPLMKERNSIVFTHMPVQEWHGSDEYEDGIIYLYGHSHQNYYYDDGVKRIYADNQIGYKRDFGGLKYIDVDNRYDWFSDYEDGIYEISREEYIKFYRGKNITMDFVRKVYTIFMLKKGGYYCFIHKSQNKDLCIMNGGAWKRLQRKDIQYYYDHMDAQITVIEKPLLKYTSIQEKISKDIKRIGGTGIIHGSIIDIDFNNHIYVNPIDRKITAYWAADIVYKKVYPDIQSLLEDKCPLLYANYKAISSMKGDKKELVIINKSLPDTDKSQFYFETDIYKASREIKKMQKLQDNILAIWIELPKELEHKQNNKHP